MQRFSGRTRWLLILLALVFSPHAIGAVIDVGETLVAATLNRNVVVVDPTTGAQTVLAALGFDPRGVFQHSSGAAYVSGGGLTG